MAKANSSRPARQYIARREDTARSRRPVRAATTEAPTAYSAHRSPTNRQAAPTGATGPLGPLFGELGRALRHEGVALAHERAARRLPETITSRPSRNGSG